MKRGKKGRETLLRESEKKSVGLERELAELKKKAETLEYELNRYKLAVGTRNKITADLHEMLDLAKRKEKANEALVALLLKHLGADEKHPIVLEHKAVGEALTGYRVLIALDEEKQTYALHFVMV